MEIKAQEDEYSYSEFEDSTLVVDVFGVDSCLFSLLDSVIDAEKRTKYYLPNSISFDFTIADKSDYRVIYISPVLSNRIFKEDYFGVFEYNGFKFLCTGELNNSILHLKNEKYCIQFYMKNDRNHFDFYLAGDTDGATTWKWFYEKPYLINVLIYNFKF